jgi:hypothetical protein
MLRALVAAALLATAYCGAKGSPQPPAGAGGAGADAGAASDAGAAVGGGADAGT